MSIYKENKNNENIKKMYINDKGNSMDYYIKPGEITIAIPLEEYRELLIIKGKYLAEHENNNTEHKCSGKCDNKNYYEDLEHNPDIMTIHYS